MEADALAKRDAAIENARRLESALAIARQAEDKASGQPQRADQELLAHGLTKPGFWARLLRTRTACEWSDKLPLESLGWLLVDEAEQALPQAAVDTLLRTRRAVIVGDAVQIEPALPDTLTNAICRRLGVDPDRYTAPSACAQTLADAAPIYTSEFRTRVGSRSVGVPLLVHRRCPGPMFGLSNAIAYSGTMVSAKSPQQSNIRNVLGPSRGFPNRCTSKGVVKTMVSRRGG